MSWICRGYVFIFAITNIKLTKSINKMEHSTSRPRPRRSVKLETAELKAFKEKVASFPTKYDAALFFGFSQVTLDNVLMRKTGKESTITAIREKIGTAA